MRILESARAHLSRLARRVAFYARGPWDLFRIIRLVLAGFLLYDGWMSGNYFLIGLGMIFGYQALARVGCVPCELKDSCEVDNSHK